MNAFKKATKRIAAVAASAAMVSSAVFGASLSNYPNNFVENGKFNGKVVVGASAAAMDTTSAASIIDDLKAEFSGDSEKVKITYKKSNSGGDSVEVADSGKALNYGESLSTVKSAAFDDGDSDLLQDENLDLKTSEDYQQTLSLANNGVFEHALRDELEDEISSHLFFAKGDVVSYKMELDSDMDVTNYDDGDIIGKELIIMGNEFTIGSYSKNAGSTGFDELELIGGSNKVSLGEGESTTVTVEGKSYDVSVQSVSDSKVLLTVNGESMSVDEYDTAEIGGVNVAITDLVPSSRDAVKGYAELVVGGQKVLLKEGSEVEINEEQISDLYEDYKVTVSFDVDSDENANEKFQGFVLTYSWENSDGFMLEAGESFDDKVFQAFSIVYDGTNNPEYSEVVLESSGEELKLSGETMGEDEFDQEIAHALDKTATNTSVRLIGGDTEMPMFVQDLDLATNPGAIAKVGATSFYSVTSNGNVIFIGTQAEIEALFTLSVAWSPGTSTVIDVKATAADNGLRFLSGDSDNQQLYEITGYSESDDEYDFEDVLSGNTKSDIAYDDVAAKLDDVATFTATTDDVFTVVDNNENNVNLAFANELLVDLSGVTSTAVTDGVVSFSYDEGDMTEDENGDIVGFDVDFGAYDTTDEEFTLTLDTTNFESFSGAEYDVAEDDDNTQERVTKYGTKVVIDAEDKKSIKVYTPEEQVYAKVSLVTGGAAAETMTVTVDAADVEDKKAELEEDGYTIVGTETMSSEEVTFDVAAPVMDSEVTGMENMIVVGGPAVNAVARALLGVEEYTIEEAGVNAGEAVIRYYDASNSVLVYGYSAEDTAAAATKLNAGGLSGSEVNVQ